MEKGGGGIGEREKGGMVEERERGKIEEGLWHTCTCIYILMYIVHVS